MFRKGAMTARVIPVIETSVVIGSGAEDDVCRNLKQYWDLSGKLLAERDEWLEQREADNDFEASF